MNLELAIKQIANLLAACDHYRGRLEEMEKDNAELRQAAVELAAIGRVWVTIWGDKLSEDSVRQFAELEKQILTK
jgi:hypothetical protein